MSALAARLQWVLELGDSFLGARSPFLPAELVYSVVLGLVLDVGLVQVLAPGELVPTLEVEHVENSRLTI